MKLFPTMARVAVCLLVLPALASAVVPAVAQQGSASHQAAAERASAAGASADQAIKRLLTAFRQQLAEELPTGVSKDRLNPILDTMEREMLKVFAGVRKKEVDWYREHASEAELNVLATGFNAPAVKRALEVQLDLIADLQQITERALTGEERTSRPVDQAKITAAKSLVRALGLDKWIEPIIREDESELAKEKKVVPLDEAIEKAAADLVSTYANAMTAEDMTSAAAFFNSADGVKALALFRKAGEDLANDWAECMGIVTSTILMKAISSVAALKS